MELGSFTLMRYGLHLFVLTCVSISCFAVEVEQIAPIGYVEASALATEPLSAQSTCSFVYQLTNVSPAPVLIDIPYNAFQPLFLRIKTPVKDMDPTQDFGVWGPGSDRDLSIKLENVAISGLSPGGIVPINTWPKRNGIIFLQNEGYARRITLMPGWLSAEEQTFIKSDYLIVNATVPLPMALPVLKPEAVLPGKEITFDKSQKVYPPGDRLLPYTRHQKKTLADENGGLDVASRIRFSVLVKGVLEAQRDAVVVYSIENVGEGAIWLYQNTCVPAHVTWTLSKRDRLLKTFDGNELQALLALSPKRPAVALNSGEILTWERLFLAEDLDIKKNTVMTLKAQLSLAYYQSENDTLDVKKATVMLVSDVCELKP